MPKATNRRIDAPGASDPQDLSALTGRITWARMRQKMTQREVGELIKKSRVAVVQYESGIITPPISVIEKLAAILKVSPSFLAFGEHVIEGIAKAPDTIVTITEISIGRDGEKPTGGFAFPLKMMEDFGVTRETAKIYVLPTSAPAFGYNAGDRLIIDTSVTTLVSDKVLYLVRTQTGVDVVRLEPTLGKSDTLTFRSSKGINVEAESDELDIIGAVAGSVRKD